MNLENEVVTLMKKGMYDPDVLFRTLYSKHPVHYSKVREAIHNAKQR